MAIPFVQSADFNGYRIINLGTPSAATDAAHKGYVDTLVGSAVGGLSWGNPVRAASNNNHTIASPGATVDGVTLNNGDRILLKAQTTASDNGVYIFNGAGSALTRATDTLKSGSVFAVNEGTANSDKVFLLTTDGTITVGTTALTFAAINVSGTSYTAGTAIDLTGNAIAVKYGNGLKIDGTGNLALDASALPGGLTKFSQNVGDGSADTITVTHNLNTFDVTVAVYELTSGNRVEVFAEVRRTSVNAIQVVFGTAPAAAAYRVVVTG